ncbi:MULTISPECIES: carbohydrate ABC transporter permease [Amycolatopsis]|uniref:Carbohydrate ABC transporter permease n=1 Tax=Amycolatopsis eburnea TaxID=2267691 RepID=A0A3R9EYA6_9PSEU|nr:MULTISPECIES: carbohydrate ABC transporter permease [Amycolatopsis]NBH09199.1 ABC transporter permease subunit [Amycolatopsis sp. SID8362]NED45892.1 carbohydrate ABC transporter permease [Amycolatopsis sp. SID8362]RSD07863.1 carbohydrate ABC transporter permease [Amycolatopsis eburnea]
MTTLQSGLRRKVATLGKPRKATYVVLAIFVLGSLFPFYWSFLVASRDNGMLTERIPPFVPGGNFFANAARVFDTVPFWKALANSVIVSGTVTLTTVLFSSLAGFAFAKLRFRGRNKLFVFIVVTLAVPTQLGIIPLFIAMSELGWTGSLTAVIVPNLVTAFGVFWMRQYTVDALPYELIEAARVDGCSMIRIFWNVCLPAVRPAAAILAMFTFMMSWNDFLWPLVVLDAGNPTVQVALEKLQSGYYVDYSLVLAGTTLATIPILIVFLLLGRQIVAGIMQGAVKG